MQKFRRLYCYRAKFMTKNEFYGLCSVDTWFSVMPVMICLIWLTRQTAILCYFSLTFFCLRLGAQRQGLYCWTNLLPERVTPLNLCKSLSLASRTGPGSLSLPLNLSLSCALNWFSEWLVFPKVCWWPPSSSRLDSRS